MNNLVTATLVSGVMLFAPVTAVAQSRMDENREREREATHQRFERLRERHEEIRDRSHSRFEGIIKRAKKAGIDTTQLESHLQELKSKHEAFKQALKALRDCKEAHPEKGSCQAEREAGGKVAKDLKDYFQNVVKPDLKAILEQLKAQNRR